MALWRWETEFLAEGTEVTVVVAPAPSRLIARCLKRSAVEFRKIMNEIAALPNENPGDTFSAADHDKVLYGAP